MDFPPICFHCLHFSFDTEYLDGYCNIYDCLVAMNRPSTYCSHFKVR